MFACNFVFLQNLIIRLCILLLLVIECIDCVQFLYADDSQIISKNITVKHTVQNALSPQNTIKRYTVHYPDVTLMTSPTTYSPGITGFSERGFVGLSGSDPFEILSEIPKDPQGGVITDSRVRERLQLLSNMSTTANDSSQTTTSSSNNTQTTPPTTQTTPNNPDTTSEKPAANEIFAVRFFQDPDTHAWLARLQEGKAIDVIKTESGNYFTVDTTGKAVQKVTLIQNNDTAKSVSQTKTMPTSQTAFLMICMVAAVLAALYVGFLAVDYKRRWEQEIINKNQRLVVSPTSGSDFDSLEPDTLQFSFDTGNERFDVFSEPSFRTIA